MITRQWPPSCLVRSSAVTFLSPPLLTTQNRECHRLSSVPISPPTANPPSCVPLCILPFLSPSPLSSSPGIQKQRSSLSVSRRECGLLECENQIAPEEHLTQLLVKVGMRNAPGRRTICTHTQTAQLWAAEHSPKPSATSL